MLTRVITNVGHCYGKALTTRVELEHATESVSWIMNQTLNTRYLYSLDRLPRPARISAAYLGFCAPAQIWPRRRERAHRPPASTLLELTKGYGSSQGLGRFEGLAHTFLFGLGAMAVGYALHSIVQFAK